MFIQSNAATISCNSFVTNPNQVTFFGLSESPLPLGNTIQLLRDDGFGLFQCAPGDYARVMFNEGTLTLTNEPESLPLPKPIPPKPAPNEDRDALLVDLDYRMTLLELGVI